MWWFTLAGLTLTYKHGLGCWCLWAWCVECGGGSVQVGPVVVEWTY